MRGRKLRQTQQDDFEGLTSIPIERRGICPKRERNDMKPEFAGCLQAVVLHRLCTACQISERVTGVLSKQNIQDFMWQHKGNICVSTSCFSSHMRISAVYMGGHWLFLRHRRNMSREAFLLDFSGAFLKPFLGLL